MFRQRVKNSANREKGDYQVQNIRARRSAAGRGARRAIFATSLVIACAIGASVEAASIERMRGLGIGGQSSVTVSMGNTQTLKSGVSYVDLVVGDPDIADAMPLTDRSFYVHGKKLGTTTISAYNANRELVGTIEVEVGYNTNRLRQELKRRLPGSNIEVSSVNGRIMLAGSVTDSGALDRAITLAKQFGPDVINSMTLSQPQQVMLEVRFIEVSRNAGKALGVQWDVAAKALNFTTGPALAASANAPFASLLGHILSGGTKADALVQALEDKGLARRLAEPNLIAMSGQTASFLAGGEFPFPVAGSLGQVSVEFKKFGVGLNFTPVVLGNGVINLKIEPEVSQIDTTNSVQTAAGPVPSLVVRRASTQIELRDGQSFAVAGLLQSTSSDNTRQLPWLGDVPVIGSLFKSTAFEKRETELAIIVTPHLVQPSKPGQKLRSPLEATSPVNDVDRFVLGKKELTPAELRETRGEEARVAQGHILDIRNGGARAIR